MKIVRLLISNFKSIVELKKLLWINAIFIITFTIKKESFNNIVYLNDYIQTIFCGPNNISDNIIELLIWSLYQFYLIYIIGDYLDKEFTIRNVFIISRIGSKLKWYLCNQLNLIFMCLVYYLNAIILTTIYVFIMNNYVLIFKIDDILNIWLLLSIYSYFISTVYLVTFLLSKNNNISFIFMIISLYLSIEFGKLLNIDAFLPLNQGILSKHIISNFSFSWSYIYLILGIVVNLFIIKHLIFKNDLLYYINNNDIGG